MRKSHYFNMSCKFRLTPVSFSILVNLRYRTLSYLPNCPSHQMVELQNTLKLLRKISFLPLFILSFIVTGPSTIFFLLTIISIFIHQLLDIANKKQAFRLSQFTLAVYYIDHIFDALSCTCIILVICRLL